jgi:DNA helicase IV
VKGSPIRTYTGDDSNSYTVETVRRAKGLEAKHAIICDPEGRMSDSELYIAIARAQHHLTVITPRTISARLKATNKVNL